MGDHVKIGQYSTVSTWGEAPHPKIVIGDNVCIGAFNHITAINRIEIGDGTLIGKYVTITDNSHGQLSMEELNVHPIKRNLYSKGGVKIGKNVWLGDKVTILPGVSIGDGSVIGSNSVVSKDIPPLVIACGNPARVIKSILK